MTLRSKGLTLCSSKIIAKWKNDNLEKKNSRKMCQLPLRFLKIPTPISYFHSYFITIEISPSKLASKIHFTSVKKGRVRTMLAQYQVLLVYIESFM